MTDSKTPPLFAQFGLWFAAVTAILAGPFFGIGFLGPNSLLVILPVVAGWLAFAGGLIVWSRLSSSETPRSRLGRAVAAIFLNVAVLVVIGLPLAAISTRDSECPASRIHEAPLPIAAFPLILYLGIGYFAFTRTSRLRWAWPLAIACGLIALFVIELIWGCK